MSGPGVGSAPHADDLEPEETEGFKVGEKKTIDEYQQLDANDESLNKWKASLGLGTGKDLSDPNDPRKVIILSLALEVQGRPDFVIDLTKPSALETLDKQPFTIKEGCQFRMKARFKVQHQILSGMKYVQVVSRMGMKNKMQEMIVRQLLFMTNTIVAMLISMVQGSYSPNTSDKQEYEKKCPS